MASPWLVLALFPVGLGCQGGGVALLVQSGEVEVGGPLPHPNHLDDGGMAHDDCGPHGLIGLGIQVSHDEFGPQRLIEEADQELLNEIVLICELSPLEQCEHGGQVGEWELICQLLPSVKFCPSRG